MRAKTIDIGILTVSADVASEASGAASETQNLLPIVELLARHGISASWAIDVLKHSETIAQLAAISPAQEMTLVAEGSWATAEASRREFTSELVRRIDAVGRHSFNPRSIVVRRSRGLAHPDVLIRHGISAVRIETETSPTRRRWLPWPSPGAQGEPAARPRMVRYGLWELPSSAVLPEASDAARVALERALQDGFGHLVIDIRRLAGRRRLLARLERTLTQAAERRERGALRIATLAQTAQLLAPVRRGQAARSILRPAA